MNSKQIIGLNLFVFITISAAQFNTFSQRNNFVSQTPANQLRAFPDCLSNTRALDSLLNPNVLKSTFDRKLQEEDNKLFPSASNVSFFHTGNFLYHFFSTSKFVRSFKEIFSILLMHNYNKTFEMLR